MSTFFLKSVEYGAGIVRPLKKLADQLIRQKKRYKLNLKMLYRRRTAEFHSSLLRNKSIEILWRKMKYEWLKPKDYDNLKTLREALEKILVGFGRDFSINFKEPEVSII
ncbi:MAG: hypothetical protein D3924_13905 [Candidatus Electrothrix sp. AR4]|nr:hypothetical protein [Candidatus Electrothrix sp. AR4]